MPNEFERLTKKELKRIACPVDCGIINQRIENLGEFFTVIDSTISGNQNYWFRGHQNSKWDLIPSALRYDTTDERKAALNLWRDFQRIAEIKMEKPPSSGEYLKWMQLARHYGIPTRLLDWTESAAFSLYFALINEFNKDVGSDGMVFILRPEDLNKLPGKTKESSLDSPISPEIIQRYVYLSPDSNRKVVVPTIAIKPVWNSERLMMQRGAFTLHGSRKFSLDRWQAPSLVGIPILKEYKAKLREGLDRIGIDEITMFPELEYVSKNLKRKAGLA